MGCGKCCGSCCSGCGHCCDTCCHDLCQVCCAPYRPFPACALFTALVNFLPAFLFFAFVIYKWHNDCGTGLAPFLLIEGLLCFLNMFFALYIYWRFSVKPDARQHAIERGARILCYDPLVCIFFFVFLFEFIWQIIGIVWIGNSHCNADSSLHVIAVLAVILMFCYLVLGGAVAFCSVCCQCCKEGMNTIDKSFSAGRSNQRAQAI